MNLGSKLNPCKDSRDIKTAITGKTNCSIYITKIFDMPYELWKEIQDRNIKLFPINR